MRSVWLRVLAVVVVLVLGAGTYVVLGTSTGTDAATAPETVPAAGKSALATDYTNTADGYRISYPASWDRMTDAQGGLVLKVGGGNAVSIRKFALARVVDTGNVGDLRAVTDALLSDADAGLTILETEQVKVAGLTGIYYLYYFPNGRQRGVHAHYFLFRGKDMFAMVFQALPASEFTALAGTFDAVAESFVALP